MHIVNSEQSWATCSYYWKCPHSKTKTEISIGLSMITLYTFLLWKCHVEELITSLNLSIGILPTLVSMTGEPQGKASTEKWLDTSNSHKNTISASIPLSKRSKQALMLLLVIDCYLTLRATILWYLPFIKYLSILGIIKWLRVNPMRKVYQMLVYAHQV